MRTSASPFSFLLALATLSALACISWTAMAGASSAHAAGTIALSLPGASPGPLVLTAGQGGWVGTLTINNVGSEPLIVSRITIRGDEDDVRSPSHTSVRFVEGPATSATLAPGGSKDVVVSWMPEKDPRVRQAFGHVVVTSTDEEAGEIAMGFRAEMPTGLGWIGAHSLSLLVLLPLLVPLVAGAARLSGRRDDSGVRHVALGVAVADLLIALSTCQRFVPDVARADGNDGFQMIERAVWVRSIGAEWYLAVDGANIALVLLAAALAVVAAVVGRPERRTDAYCATMALLVSGIMCALVALDLVLVFAAWQLVLMAVTMLVGGWGGRRGERAAAKLSVYWAIGSAAMLALFVALSRASGQTFLVDGTAAAHTLSIPELARTSFASKDSLAGVPFVEVAWGLLVIAVAVTTPIVPLHGWLADVIEEAPAGVAIVVSGVVLALGPYFLVRVGVGVMPEGARWAGGSIAALGVLGVAYGALCAMAQPDIRGFVAYAAIANAGAGMFGIGSLTSQGIAGALSGAFSHGLAVALLLGTAAALERRLRTCELAHVGALGREAPWLGAMSGVGLAVSLGAPGFAGFWGPLLSLLGGFAQHPILALLLAAALVIHAAAHLRVARSVLLGHVDAERRPGALLDSLGGHLPDATARELSALAPVVAVALLLGIWPAPLLSSMGAVVRDVSLLVADQAVPTPQQNVDAR